MAEKTLIAWTDIPRSPGYRINKTGQIQSCWKRVGLGRGNGTRSVQTNEWHELKTPPGAYGNPVVNLGRGKRRSVARLVLETFAGPCPEGMECCHFPDANPMNCHLENLRWDTSKANTDDQRKHSKLIGGQRHGMAKLTDFQITEIRSLAGTMTQREIASRFGIKQPHVSDILNGKKRTQNSHAGRGN